MTAALSVDTDELEHAAGDLKEAASQLSPLAQAPLGADLYQGIAGGPSQVPPVLKLLQRRTEEAHAIALNLSGLCQQNADRLLACARHFEEAEDLCTLGEG